MPLTDELRSKFGFDPKVKGVLVTEIDPDSPAASKNIKVGDVIVEAQQEPVATPSDIEAAIDKVKKTRRQDRAAAGRGRQGRHALRRRAVLSQPCPLELRGGQAHSSGLRESAQ